jgi:hypothetical protein
MRLDAAAVLLQWATGGLAFLWVTTRRREVGLGYGWMMRATFGLMALGAFGVAQLTEVRWGRDLASLGVAGATGAALVVSVVRRRAGVAGQRERVERRSARVAVMTGIDRDVQVFDKSAAEFPPALDLIAPVIGAAGLVAASTDSGGPWLTAVLRLLVGAAFLGAVTDAMLLGHWYLVQPGLARAPLRELVRWTAYTWPPELVVLLLAPGMVSVLTGEIDDGYAGLLGWFWVACTVATIALVGVTWAALKERQYSAVMAATGLLYLAILTAFGMDLVARAVLS